MICEEILQKRILILSGKGGVGKSVMAATLASIAAKAGKRVLLVELDTIASIPQIFGKPRPEGYHETDLAPQISRIHIDGRSCLEEYLQLVLKSKRFAQRIFQSPIYEYFVNIAPGLKELMAVGKLWDLEQKTVPKTKRPLYDLIIVDTPATGHTVSYFRMPMTASNTVRKGFVNKEAQKVVALLQDPSKTSFNIVTTLAEMPVSEAIELHGAVSSQLSFPLGWVFINQVHPPFFSGPELDAYLTWKDLVRQEDESAVGPADRCRKEEQTILACAESWRKRREAQELQLDRLRRRLKLPLAVIPLVSHDDSPLVLLQRLSQALETPEISYGMED